MLLDSPPTTYMSLVYPSEAPATFRTGPVVQGQLTFSCLWVLNDSSCYRQLYRFAEKLVRGLGFEPAKAYDGAWERRKKGLDRAVPSTENYGFCARTKRCEATGSVGSSIIVNLRILNPFLIILMFVSLS